VTAARGSEMVLVGGRRLPLNGGQYHLDGEPCSAFAHQWDGIRCVPSPSRPRPPVSAGVQSRVRTRLGNGEPDAEAFGRCEASAAHSEHDRVVVDRPGGSENAARPVSAAPPTAGAWRSGG